MNKLSLTALLVAMLSATVGVPGYVTAADCCPGSGCCGPGQTYVGQQLFPNPAGYAPVGIGPAARPPQTMNATNVPGSGKKARGAQTKAKPALPLAPQGAMQSPSVVTLSRPPTWAPFGRANLQVHDSTWFGDMGTVQPFIGSQEVAKWW